LFLTTNIDKEATGGSYMKKALSTFLLLIFISSPLKSSEYEITILATNIANFGGIGEWSFSALLESETESILFDTGFDENTVLHNANLLKKDLSKVEKVIISHFHGDHTGGLIKLRNTFKDKNPKAFSTAYVAKDFFLQRYDANGSKKGFIGRFNDVEDFIDATKEAGIRFKVLDATEEIATNLFVSGPVDRSYEDVVVSPGLFIRKNGALKPDNVPDDQSLGILTNKGWYMMSGCGHSGIVNTARLFYSINSKPIYGAIGGFHLFQASDEVVEATAYELEKFGLKKLVGAHCTGIHAAQKISELLDISRKNLSHGAIGTMIKPNHQIIRSSVEQ